MTGSDPTATPAGAFTRAQRMEAYPKGIGTHAWFQGRNRIIHAKLPDAARRGVVLDVGCGSGITVAHLRSKNVDCHGCDLADYEPDDPGHAPYLTYRTGALSLPDDFRAEVRTLLMLDVLEHIERPKDLLSECLRGFPTLGHVLITLPARMELWSDYDERFGHVTRFDHRSLRDLCDVPGLQRVSSGYFFHSLYAVLRTRGRGSVGKSIAPPRSPRLHSAIGALLHLEEALLPASLPGSSIYALLRVTR